MKTLIVDTDDVLALFGASDRDIYAMGTIEDAIYDGTLKPAETERKTGRWIKVNGNTAINCSACYHCSWSLSFEDTVKEFSFCPNCGAKMLKEGEG